MSFLFEREVFYSEYAALTEDGFMLPQEVVEYELAPMKRKQSALRRMRISG